MDSSQGSPPPYTPLPAMAPRRSASQAWLNNPAWIDGGVDPPQFYYSHEEINATLLAYGMQPRPVVQDSTSKDLSEPPVLTRQLVIGPAVSVLAPRDPHPDPLAATPAPAHMWHLIPYQVNVTMIYMGHPPPTSTSGCGAKPTAPKKMQHTKMDRMEFVTITTCVEFIKMFLAAHELQSQFSPGIHAGPVFCIWWTSQSKENAPTIQNDADFDTAKVAILERDKTKTKISVEFELFELEKFRISIPVGLSILKLKKSGHAKPTRALRLKIRASALAAGNVTKHEPPNVPAFDALASDTTLTAALVAAILGQKQGHSPDLEFTTPRKRCSELPASSPITSPAPKFDNILRACLLDMATHHNLDFVRFESILQKEDYTPNIILFVEDETLMSLLELSPGTVTKFKRSCKEWFQRYEKKVGLYRSVFDD
ncbi:hypothetical protein CPB83DRAFT_892993 [Crepidotus variabilis]|uniref:Uncharacterized protein n=1 Tax=Crepidotus variabilis TaxID=179855 RepID=A0A9P6EI26_9AGAR|nr:hypothetical protein CPB83DRAFT_892993 [Crepidotus variabilis]